MLNFFENYELQNQYIQLNDVREFKMAYPKINYRYYLEPVAPLLPGYKLLTVNKQQTQAIIDQGREDMKKVIAMGPGKSWEEVKPF